MTIRARLCALAIAAIALLAAPAVTASDEGILLGSTREVRVTGRMFDSKTDEPLAEAQVTLEGPYHNERAATGPDGSFSVSATAEQGLGNVSVIFSHSEYQQKYLETILRDAFPGRVEVAVSNGRAKVKAKKLDVDVTCGSTAEVATRYGDASPFKIVCDGGLTGVEFEVRHNRIAVLASGPFTLRVEDGALEVRDSKNGSIEIRVDAAMMRR